MTPTGGELSEGSGATEKRYRAEALLGANLPAQSRLYSTAPFLNEIALISEE